MQRKTFLGQSLYRVHHFTPFGVSSNIQTKNGAPRSNRLS
ncbi:hypothetical Protein YC6258_00211 [Gynuella sunshinyii YC6258]|uniref:Uncharacterized protein n=1 Tax=Gynuella sunshinyii YC6258 TaxID=1445510 RepID=A0A0C5VCR5_9GAMM|nr:hypothetical Protein YC6258_00211 [Gynuella sunshinyii YC6258]